MSASLTEEISSVKVNSLLTNLVPLTVSQVPDRKSNVVIEIIHMMIAYMYLIHV